ncbi:lipase [Kitasatospora sp. MMS16-BH015]|uniref:esterase/lipase family protein n=1 Tax=Kitasatospora sp. MMS16-BH015 TaxID=2018025 RepID=UPI000CA2A02B|nr:alpha/beta fold hydrolase [Kitasatospora sp. MMS16-BH015]AUG80579.1 lipase [Kitasatospora sp. MMS16-BH015]
MRTKRVRAAVVPVLAAAGLLAAAGQPAGAAGGYPVDYHFATGFVAGFFGPGQAPPGANDWSCRPTAAHPDPVVLVHGTFENQNDNWHAAAPLLADNGYCVYAFNYGAAQGDPIQGTGPVAVSAGQLASFVDRVLAATGAAEVDLVGHSQGGMMPRYYLKYLGGAAKTARLVSLAGSHNGTTIDGITELGRQIGLLEPANAVLDLACRACVEQEVGSPFLADLNAGGETVPGVEYTAITTRFDEVVTPYTNALLPAAPNVTDITLQDQCALDASDHLEIAADPIAMTDVLNALDPAHPRPIPCQVVLPVTGPLL